MVRTRRTALAAAGRLRIGECGGGKRGKEDLI